MEEGVLSKNLGVPLVLIVAKADVSFEPIILQCPGQSHNNADN